MEAKIEAIMEGIFGTYKDSSKSFCVIPTLVRVELEKHLQNLLLEDKEEEVEKISTKEYIQCLMSNGMIGYTQMKSLLQKKGLRVE